MKTKLLALLALSAALVSPAIAALDVVISAEIRFGRVPPPPPPEVEIIAEAGPPGPPPWAPAHGFRRNRSYYYYPGTNVYYRPADRMWVYLDGRDWRVGLNLPATMRVDFDRGVSLTMETDRPDEFHDKVRLYYPSDYFVSKVRLKGKGNRAEKKDREVNRQEDDRGGGRDDDHGKGKGKDKRKDK